MREATSLIAIDTETADFALSGSPEMQVAQIAAVVDGRQRTKIMAQLVVSGQSKEQLYSSLYGLRGRSSIITPENSRFPRESAERIRGKTASWFALDEVQDFRDTSDTFGTPDSITADSFVPGIDPLARTLLRLLPPSNPLGVRTMVRGDPMYGVSDAQSWVFSSRGIYVRAGILRRIREWMFRMQQRSTPFAESFQTYIRDQEQATERSFAEQLRRFTETYQRSAFKDSLLNAYDGDPTDEAYLPSSEMREQVRRNAMELVGNFAPKEFEGVVPRRYAREMNFQMNSELVGLTRQMLGGVARFTIEERPGVAFVNPDAIRVFSGTRDRDRVEIGRVRMFRRAIFTPLLVIAAGKYKGQEKRELLQTKSYREALQMVGEDFGGNLDTKCRLVANDHLNNRTVSQRVGYLMRRDPQLFALELAAIMQSLGGTPSGEKASFHRSLMEFAYTAKGMSKSLVSDPVVWSARRDAYTRQRTGEGMGKQALLERMALGSQGVFLADRFLNGVVFGQRKLSTNAESFIGRFLDWAPAMGLEKLSELVRDDVAAAWPVTRALGDLYARRKGPTVTWLDTFLENDHQRAMVIPAGYNVKERQFVPQTDNDGDIQENMTFSWNFDDEGDGPGGGGYRTAGTQTGRFSSSGVNMSNIPKPGNPFSMGARVGTGKSPPPFRFSDDIRKIIADNSVKDMQDTDMLIREEALRESVFPPRDVIPSLKELAKDMARKDAKSIPFSWPDVMGSEFIRAGDQIKIPQPKGFIERGPTDLTQAQLYAALSNNVKSGERVLTRGSDGSTYVAQRAVAERMEAEALSNNADIKNVAVRDYVTSAISEQLKDYIGKEATPEVADEIAFKGVMPNPLNKISVEIPIDADTEVTEMKLDSEPYTPPDDKE